MVDIVRLSRVLSKILRHSAQEDNIPITSDGWVEVNKLLQHINRRSNYTIEDVKKVVNENDKQRFSLRELTPGNLQIRANQGHSMSGIQVDLTKITDSSNLLYAVHGTYYKAWKEISKKGISRMNRNHIHLARDLPGESGVISGMRGSCEVLIWIDIKSSPCYIAWYII